MSRMSFSTEFGHKMIDLEYNSDRQKPFKLSWWNTGNDDIAEIETDSIKDLERLASNLQRMADFAIIDGV